MGNRSAMHYVRGLFYFIHTHKLNSVKKAGPLLFLFALRAAKNPIQTTCKYSEFVVKLNKCSTVKGLFFKETF